jgi:hypothetical protein
MRAVTRSFQSARWTGQKMRQRSPCRPRHPNRCRQAIPKRVRARYAFYQNHYLRIPNSSPPTPIGAFSYRIGIRKRFMISFRLLIPFFNSICSLGHRAPSCWARHYIFLVRKLGHGMASLRTLHRPRRSPIMAGHPLLPAHRATQGAAWRKRRAGRGAARALPSPRRRGI